MTMNAVTKQEAYSYDHAKHETYLAADEAEIIETYRRAKTLGYADILITVQEGCRVKLWLTEKRK